ncbi:mitochondria-eating protein-like [Watersipora subatra]|uniref:mitochondria-eating protein-like n=1 Tax=Watersipora subatra TaxID=2589382 RepID=UPI00355C8E6B
MADSLRRLVNIGSFGTLQDKLDRWLDVYHYNTSDQNVARCCEIIELNGKVQGQLFKLLSLVASGGGMYGASLSTIKSRLLPHLGSSYFGTASVTAEASLACLAKERELREVQDMYEDSLATLEDELSLIRRENSDLRDELLDTKDELNNSMRASSSDRMLDEAEIRDLRAKLAAAEAEKLTLKCRTGHMDDLERQCRSLREDIALLTGRRDTLRYSSPTRSYTTGDQTGDLSDSLKSYRYLARASSPLSTQDVTQRVRQESLINRFNDLFSIDRLNAMDTLGRYQSDYEMNQRICNAVVQEAFVAAKLAFREHKMKVRSNLAITHVGPETLEEAVQDYINRNTDLFDLPGIISDVTRALNRSLKLYIPPEASYSLIQPYIREACKLAWECSSLAHPLDVALATDAELFDDHKYRRSYDSEYSAPLVNHHIFPCLMQGIRVLVKGEACTRRGASLSSPRRSRSRSTSPVRFALGRTSRSRSRSVSPRRSMSPLRTRSRSPSPRFGRSSSPLGLVGGSRSASRGNSSVTGSERTISSLRSALKY